MGLQQVIREQRRMTAPAINKLSLATTAVPEDEELKISDTSDS